MSVNTRNLSPRGNSAKLLIKFNKVRRIKNAITYLDTLIAVLEEIRNLDLIWNQEIPLEIAKRKTAVEQERKERARLRALSPRLERLSKTIDIYNRLSIAEKLKRHPNVQQSVLGALDCLQRGGPDAERQCITSCRASVEALCIEIGKNGNWKIALDNIFPSETDRKVIKNIWNYLSGKGAHGGHTTTKEEAEYALKITIVTLEKIANKEGIL